MNGRLETMDRRYDEIERELSRPDVVSDPARLQALGRERAGLERSVTLYRRLRALDHSIAETSELLGDGHEPEFEVLAREELEQLRSEREAVEVELRSALITTDPNEQRDAILEIRGAAGGEEAALFARDLFRMYLRFADEQGWKTQVLSINETGTGGIKEVVARIAGKCAYGRLKYESGVHRVQRVPVTESSGRIHTSTVTVIVLPEIEDDVEVEIREEDLRVDVFRSSGHGGQSVNTTDSAVRITHLPTGIVATSQNERSQIQNRASAMAVLRSRIYEAESQRREAEAGAHRRTLVQSGERSEKIRTYNFPQDRITDHRIGVSVHNLPGLLDGALDPLIDRLSDAERARELEQEG